MCVCVRVCVYAHVPEWNGKGVCARTKSPGSKHGLRRVPAALMAWSTGERG